MKSKIKKIAITAALLMSTIVLASCGKNSSKDYSTTGSGNGNYQGVIQNGRYKTSKARGINVAQNDNQFNQKSFESGLTQVSKRVFSPKSYIFQEGQYLNTGTLQSWLGRKTKKNPNGLNPTQGKKSDPNPEYIQQIEEQDYMTDSGRSMKLEGVVIGVGINSEYNYQKKTDGPSYTKKISKDEMQQQGEIAAQKILTRLREKKDLRDVPIVIALYKQAPDDSLVGGSFFAYSKNNGNKISKWTKLDYKTMVLPKASATNATTSADSTDNDNFANFKSQIQGFFPNLSGVTAQAQYHNGQLSGMHITVTTQFYSQTEITSFTQYIARAAKRYLPSGIPIDIRIQSDSEMQAIVYRDAGSDTFRTHVLDSY